MLSKGKAVALFPQIRFAVCSSLFAIALLMVGALTAPATAASVRFSAAQIKQLKHWGITPVAPSNIPSGYRGTVSLDHSRRAYDITYTGSRGGAFVWEGGPADLEDGLVPKTNSVVSFFKNIFGHHAASAAGAPTSSSLAPQNEVNNKDNDVAATSTLIGPAHFKPARPDAKDPPCQANIFVVGVSQRGIGTTKYSLRACNVPPDDLVSIYRSAAEVRTH